MGSKNALNISKLGNTKVSQLDYNKLKEDLNDQIEAIRFATYDNYRVSCATDNFLEKYLPFQIQELISKNMLSVVKKPFTSEQIVRGEDRNPTEQEKRMA